MTRLELIERLKYQIYMLEKGDTKELLDMLKSQLEEAEKGGNK